MFFYKMNKNFIYNSDKCIDIVQKKEKKKNTHKKCRKSQTSDRARKNSVYQSKLKEGEKYKITQILGI